MGTPWLAPRRSGPLVRSRRDRSLRNAFLAATLLLAAATGGGRTPCAEADQDAAAVDRRARYAARLAAAPDDIQVIVNRAKKYLASVGATFEVGYTSALDHPPEVHQPRPKLLRPPDRLDKNRVLKRLREADRASREAAGKTWLAGCDPAAGAFSWNDDEHPERDAVGLPGDQGDCSCCWAFGTLAALEGSDAIRNGQGRAPRCLDGSVQDLVNCLWEEANCFGGDERLALDRLVAYGCALESAIGYVGAPVEDPPECPNIDRPLRGVCWAGVEIPPDARPEEVVRRVKEALCAHGPLASEIQFESYPPEELSGYQAFDFYVGGDFDYVCHEGGSLGHLVVIVGWDDGRGSWRIQNSRGTNWGEDGFAWVKYGTCGLGEVSFWIDAESRVAPPMRPPALDDLRAELRDLLRRLPQDPSRPPRGPWPPFPPRPPFPGPWPPPPPPPYRPGAAR